ARVGMDVGVAHRHVVGNEFEAAAFVAAAVCAGRVRVVGEVVVVQLHAVYDEVRGTSTGGEALLSSVEVPATDDVPTDAELRAGTVGRAVADVVDLQVVQRPSGRARRVGRMDRADRGTSDVIADLES